MHEEIKIQVRFEKDGLNDALYFTLEEYDKITDEEIEAMKQERVDKWQYNLANPPIPKETTEEELIAEKEGIESQLIALQNRKDELTAIIEG